MLHSSYAGSFRRTGHKGRLRCTHPQADAVDTSAVLRRVRIRHGLPLLLT